MTDFKIDYTLNRSEIITFPFAPTYGLRHLKIRGWKNKLIGAIELFPVLGPIVALIERAVVACLQAKQKTSQSNNLEKIKAFKKNVLANFEKVQTTKSQETIPAELILSAEQEQALTTAVEEFYKFKNPNNVKIHSRNQMLVFSISEIPDMIFKTASPGTTGCMLKRFEATQKAKSIIESEKLHLLHVPKQKLQDIKIKDRNLKVLIEQKFDILHGYGKQRSLFQYCIKDKELQPFIQECARQLVILISKTGYEDVRYDNNPILSNGAGLALIDFDTSTDPITGLNTGCTRAADDGILRYITPKMIDEFEPLLKQLLPGETFDTLKLPEIREENQKAVEMNLEFAKYLTNQNVLTAREKVHFQGWTLAKTAQTEFNKELENTVNYVARKNLGISPVDERKFFIAKSIRDKSASKIYLNKLKAKHKIFDWVEHPRYGFYVWC